MPEAFAVPSYVFRPEVEAALRLVAQTDRLDVSDAMAQFVGSLVHPDFVCNLASICLLDLEAKRVALDLFACAATAGISADEQGTIAAWLKPVFDRALGLPPR
ncbi:hypothetical protein DBR42_01240 [Pelomonas sp. HMWF004]|nr:hypothetical protein DBR42_01240 [Pelomonas sp. HMWF004]